MARRKKIPLIEIVASLAAERLGLTYDQRRLMTAEEVMARVHVDHDPIPHAQGGPDKHYNLTVLPVAEHQKKTAEQDIPQIAKTKRIARKDAQHKAVMALKVGQVDVADEALRSIADPKRQRPKKKIQSRGFSKGYRPLRSRNSFERRPA